MIKSKVNYYNQCSPIGKPIIDLLGIEYRDDCIQTLQYAQYYQGMNFNTLTAIKYLWRLGQKTTHYTTDIEKAIDYFGWALDDELNVLNVNLIPKIELAIAKCTELRFGWDLAKCIIDM